MDPVTPVVLVDPAERRRSTLANALEQNGCTVRICANASEAVSLIASARTAVVVLEVALGEVDGFELCRRIKSSPVAPAVLLVGQNLGAPAEQVRGIAAGADAVLARDGEPLDVAHATRALAERAARRAHLELSEPRWRTLADSLPAIVFVADEAGQVEWLNRRWFDYTGQPPSSVAWLEPMHPEDRDALLAEWPRAVAGGQDWQREHRLRGAGGGYRWFLVRCVPVRDVHGGVSRWFGTATDIDDQKRHEEALRRASEFREQILGVVGHDLRNPLSAISMAAAIMLKRGTLPEDQSRTAARIANSADRMARIIEQVLDFTRSRLGGGIPIRPQPIDLASICRQVAEEIEIAHPQSKVLVTVDGDATGEVDGPRLAQVVSNLIGNAVQYGRAGAPITVRLRGGADHLEVSVHNDGPAIPADVLPLIFEPFRRGKDEPHGTGSLGLGLYIAQQVVVAHGGRIAVESRESDGTTFTARIPKRAT